jgi:hypothetical protein
MALKRDVLAIRAEIAAALSDKDADALTWYRPSTRHARRIWIEEGADLERRESWDTSLGWLTERAGVFLRVFKPRIRRIVMTLRMRPPGAESLA